MTNLSQTRKCPDCGGELEEGLSFGQHLLVYAKYNHENIKNKKHIIMPLGLKNIRRIFQYRCNKCSRIFSYADDFIILKSSKKQYLYVILFIYSLLIIYSIISLVF